MATAPGSHGLELARAGPHSDFTSKTMSLVTEKEKYSICSVINNTYSL
jgi:hypothetical protein